MYYLIRIDSNKLGGGVVAKKLFSAARAFKSQVSGIFLFCFVLFYFLFFCLKLASPKQICAKICVSGAKNQQKLVFKCKIFFLQKMKVGSQELEKGLKKWLSRAKMWPEKEGLEGGTSPYHLPM